MSNNNHYDRIFTTDSTDSTDSADSADTDDYPYEDAKDTALTHLDGLKRAIKEDRYADARDNLHTLRWFVNGQMFDETDGEDFDPDFS